MPAQDMLRDACRRFIALAVGVEIRRRDDTQEWLPVAKWKVEPFTKAGEISEAVSRVCSADGRYRVIFILRTGTRQTITIGGGS